MRIYVAGPMTGLPEFNIPAFNAAAAQLRALGHKVENPADNAAGGTAKPHAWYLRAALRQLLLCDGVALLPGWEASVGARLEVNVAASIGCRVCTLSDWLEKEPRP